MTSSGDAIVSIVLWGFIATGVLGTIQFGAQSLGYSRLSLPYLLGTMFTGDRRAATQIGFCLYWLGGWLFSICYFLVFASLHQAGWWLGGLIGILHGLMLLAIVMPVLPYLHPRMASPFAGPGARAMLHPPGFLALHYGIHTPLVTVLASACYGLILGAGLRI